MDQLSALTEALERAWSAKTSADPERWSPDNPAWGQCAVTACVVQDALGGRILRRMVTLPDGETCSHYLNLVSEEIVDLTWRQFPAGAVRSDPEPRRCGHASTRDYVLSHQATRERYELLRDALELASA